MVDFTIVRYDQLLIETKLALLYLVQDILALWLLSLPKQSTLKVSVSNGEMLTGPNNLHVCTHLSQRNMNQDGAQNLQVNKASHLSAYRRFQE